MTKTFKSLRLLQKWCWEAQLWLEINYGSFLTKCRKQNFDLGPNFHFLAQNSRFWPKLAIFAIFWSFFIYKIVKKQNKQNSSDRILTNNICQDSVRGILFILRFDHFINEKRPKNCPQMAIFGQKRLFWDRKWKIGPKSTFCFLHFVRNDP